MSRAPTTRTVADQITTLLTGFTLTTAAREMVSRFIDAAQQPALPVLLDVLQLEAQSRVAARLAEARSLRRVAPRRCGLHPTESRRGRNPLHAPRRTLRTTLGRDHEQFDLRAVGSDL